MASFQGDGLSIGSQGLTENSPIELKATFSSKRYLIECNITLSKRLYIISKHRTELSVRQEKNKMPSGPCNGLII